MQTVGIAVEKAAYGYDMLYSYLVPEEMRQEIVCGSRVLVPFGKGNRKRIGIVLEIGEADNTSKMKEIAGILPKDVELNDEAVKLVSWLKETTFCTYYEAAKSILPPGLSAKHHDSFELGEIKEENPLSEEETEFYELLKNTKSTAVKAKLLDTSESESKRLLIDSLLKKGALIKNESIKRKIGDETVHMIRLTEDFLETHTPPKLTAKQKTVADTLLEYNTASVSEICEICGVTSAVLKNLQRNNVVVLYEEKQLRSNAENIITDTEPIVLSKLQQKVFGGIKALIDSDKPEAALLHGVTGSGKTSVYLKLIEHTLNCGKNVIMMIPEISLTPQMLAIFKNRFGSDVAIIHSGLSMGMRVDEYRRIKNGDAKIVVGTRSAVFAPLDNIGLIIIDEEGEHTYKSESSPRYDAREVAKKRCVYHNSTLLLASATPSVESYYKAKTGKYKLFELNERYKNSVLPEVYMVDMKDELDSGNNTDISRPLKEELEKNLKAGEQSILLLNRRGYNTYASCMSCRQPMVCPNCNIALTYHKHGGRMVCHYCGYSKPLSNKCESCGGQYIKFSGAGTQKAEDELSELFPEARILRMDADTACSKFSYEKNFNAFAKGQYDIMIGTQMIAKGLDFPNVTLVGVLSVDKALYAGDFKSYERTFSLITQVVGRGGRGDKKARAYIQTFSPEHYVLNLAALQDYKVFYENETAVRKALLYPPYCDLCVMGFSSLVEASASTAAEIFVETIAQNIKNKGNIPVRILGPSRAELGKINKRYRYRAVIKCRNNAAFRKAVSETLIAVSKKKEFENVGIYVDLNGEIGL